jgi:hypothetical protein
MTIRKTEDPVQQQQKKRQRIPEKIRERSLTTGWRWDI